MEEYLSKLQKVFHRFMSKDALSPHVKFLWVIERLQERWQGIKTGKQNICRSNGKSTPLSETTRSSAQQEQAGAQTSSGADPSHQQDISQAAAGLHVLSQAAVHDQQQQHPQDPYQQWYQPPPTHHQQQQQDAQQAAAAMSLPMDPNAYLYAPGAGGAGAGAVSNGYEFDYGLAVLGGSMMDGSAIGGLFDPMWGFGQTPDPGNGQHGFGGW